MRVSADTFHLVAAALFLRKSSFGRRLTVAAVRSSTFIAMQLELFSSTDPVGAADADSMFSPLLLLLLMLWMLLPSPGRVHLAIVVDVEVAVAVEAVLELIVGGDVDSIDAPPEARLRFAKL